MSHPALANLPMLRDRILKAYKERLRLLTISSSKPPSHIANGLYFELGVHLVTTADTAMLLINELAKWGAELQDTGHSITHQVNEIGINLAIASIEDCVKVIEVDHTEQLIAIGKTILDKAMGLLPGIDEAKFIYEVLRGISEAKDVWTSGSARFAAGAKVLAEFEFTATMGLLAIQSATFQVHQVANPAKRVHASDEPMEQLSKRGMEQAKQEVIARYHEKRKQIMKGGLREEDLNFIQFPNDGFWPRSDDRVEELSKSA